MKTYCKKIDPSDVEIIERYAWECLAPKLRRKDYSRFFSQYCSMTAKQIRRSAQDHEGLTAQHREGLQQLAQDIRARIVNGNLELPPVRYEHRFDGMSRKERVIGIESVMQQVMEHIAVGCMDELWAAKYEYHQYASIKGKGQLKGAQTIQRWTKQGKTCYWVKGDIRGCFRNLKREVVMKYLRRDIGKNKLLLQFVDALLLHHGDGLIIGSLLSQFLTNYVLSYAYRYVKTLAKERRGKRINLVNCALLYMDDILLTGNDRRNLVSAMRKMKKWARDNLGLEIKSTWHVHAHADAPIDMMGYRITAAGRIKVRPRIFLRARHAFDRATKSATPALKICSRVSAYYGYLKAAGIHELRRKQKQSTIRIKAVMDKTTAIISLNARRTLLCSA